MTSTRTRALLLVVPIAAVLAGLGGCSKDASVASSSGAAPAPQSAAASGKASTNGVKIESGSAPSTAAPANGQAASVQVLDQPPADAGRLVVSTATMTVKVDDVVSAKEKSKAKIDGIGGQLFNEQTSLGTKSTATITYKVKPDKFSEALRDLGSLGRLASEEVKTDDVTQQAVDLDARIRAAEASTQRVGELVGRVNSVGELANLENEVQRRQAELESLRGQKRTLEARTELATIVLTLTTDDAPPAAPKTEEAKALPGFFDGLSGGWGALQNVLSVAGAFLGALLPFAWVFLLVAGVVWMSKRRVRPAPHADAQASA